MADDLNKNAEFGGKHKDEEDPILVAQRYLNIYRQIHIFNKVRQAEFDDSLLKLPSDIRILLSTLPGGSVLLDHISEIEEARGITVTPLPSINEPAPVSKKNKAEKKKRRIEEAFEDGEQTSPKGANLPNNVLKLLKQSEQKHERDMQALTNVFLQSQENIASILKEVLNAKQSMENAQHSISENQSDANNYVQQNNAQMNTETTKTVFEESEPQHNTPKLFSFTKRLFGGRKENKDDDTLPTLGDNTPVSLDEIDDTPISLDGETTSLSTNQTADTQKSDAESSDVTDVSNIATDEDNDWEWEYVDDENADDEWEYVEVPEGEDEKDWEYIEVPEDASETVSEDSITESAQSNTHLPSEQQIESTDIPTNIVQEPVEIQSDLEDVIDDQNIDTNQPPQVEDADTSVNPVQEFAEVRSDLEDIMDNQNIETNQVSQAEDADTFGDMMQESADIQNNVEDTIDNQNTETDQAFQYEDDQNFESMPYETDAYSSEVLPEQDAEQYDAESDYYYYPENTSSEGEEQGYENTGYDGNIYEEPLEYSSDTDFNDQLTSPVDNEDFYPSSETASSDSSAIDNLLIGNDENDEDMTNQFLGKFTASEDEDIDMTTFDLSDDSDMPEVDSLDDPFSDEVDQSAKKDSKA